MPRDGLSPGSTHALDKSGFVPLYFQIQRALMQKIRSGELREGDPLASEEELARVHQVSRMTARQALHGLKSSGFARSHKGRGTFVTRPKMEKNLLHLQGFSEDMRQRGMVPSSRLLLQEVEPAAGALAAKLHLAEGDPVLHLRRLRLADGVPMALEETRVPLNCYPGLQRFSFGRHSLYTVLRERYGLEVGWADEVIEAVAATQEESALLTVPRRSCVLSIARTIMSTADLPVEVACSRYRGDHYRAFVRVPAVASGGHPAH